MSMLTIDSYADVSAKSYTKHQGLYMGLANKEETSCLRPHCRPEAPPGLIATWQLRRLLKVSRPGPSS